MKEVIVDTLIIEEDRPAHIAKHDIIIDEVLEVLTGDYVYIAGRENRWLIIGKTARKVFLTIVLGERSEENIYGLITARQRGQAKGAKLLYGIPHTRRG